MKLVSYNIRFGLGLDQQIDLGRIADTVRDADIVCLQEVERFWKRSGGSDQPEILRGHLKEFYSVFCPAFDMDASERDEQWHRFQSPSPTRTDDAVSLAHSFLSAHCVSEARYGRLFQHEHGGD